MIHKFWLYLRNELEIDEGAVARNERRARARSGHKAVRSSWTVVKGAAILLVAGGAVAACGGAAQSGSKSPWAINTITYSGGQIPLPTSTSTPSSSSSKTSPTNSTAPATSAAENLPMTSTVEAQLLAAEASAHYLTASAYTGLVKGSVYYAYDPATTTYWARARVIPSPLSGAAEASLNQGGAFQLYERLDGGNWTEHDVGSTSSVGSPAGPVFAKCTIVVPAAVLDLWQWPPGTCRPPAPGTPATRILPPATIPPVGLKCSHPITRSEDGNAVPTNCADGRINVEAWKFYAPLGRHVMSLGQGATLAQIKQAMCADESDEHASFPEIEFATELAREYYGWSAPNLAQATQLAISCS